MKQDKLTPARLIFSEEERKTDGLQKPISQVKKAEQQVDRIRRRLYKANHPEFQAEVSKLSAPQDRKAFDNILRAGIPERKTAASTADIPQRLIVEESLIGKVPKKHDSLIGQTMKAELHREISKAEEDSTGLQAAHTLERSGETALHTADQGKLIGQKHRLHQTEQAVKRLDHANVRFLQAKHEMEHPKPAGNPFARSYQRRMIQKEYAMAKAGKATGRTAASRSAQKAVRKGEKAAGSFLKKKGTWLLLGLVGLLVVVMNMMSSCTPLLEAALQAIVMGTYPAEEADVKAAERAYRNMEKELEREMEDYERYHPGHDEYIVDADEIWHDPYALIALIFAYHGGEEWTIDSAYPTIEMLFEWQYVVEESVTTQTRYRQEGEEQIPYTYSICTVTMENKNLSHAPVYIMSREKVGLYAMYMSTLGNMPGLFTGAHASTLKDPLEYDVPQELLDADPKFALLVEEANKRLGYPYVWGGYDPETSFDCSGFISWLFTSTGINNIGHMGATTLYGYSDPIAPHEAKPGDMIFFEGTMGDDVGGITHCGLYVGNNMMVHCGNPCSYADLTESYWVEHFYGFGRLYD